MLLQLFCLLLPCITKSVVGSTTHSTLCVVESAREDNLAASCHGSGIPCEVDVWCCFSRSFGMALGILQSCGGGWQLAVPPVASCRVYLVNWRLRCRIRARRSSGTWLPEVNGSATVSNFPGPDLPVGMQPRSCMPWYIIDGRRCRQSSFGYARMESFVV